MGEGEGTDLEGGEEAGVGHFGGLARDEGARMWCWWDWDEVGRSIGGTTVRKSMVFEAFEPDGAMAVVASFSGTNSINNSP